MQGLKSIEPVTTLYPPVIDSGLEERPKQFCWHRDEYYRMAELGFFNEKRVELIYGEIIEMAPMGSPHATSISILGEILRQKFGRGYFVRFQSPLDVDDHSQPEPDLAVLPGTPRDFTDAHPRGAVLAAEVSFSSLGLDRDVKTKLYAQCSVKEYWILNLKDRCLEIYRKPVKDPNLGFIYSERRVYGANEFVSPIDKPKARIKVADILP